VSFWVYILTNRSKHPFYTGVTRSLENRTFDHKAGRSDYTSRYKLDRLVYFEEWRDPLSAIEREKEIKGWTRLKKMQLIVSINPGWKDLSDEWFRRHRYQPDDPPNPKQNT
jgi:putative endonuclease